MRLGYVFPCTVFSNASDVISGHAKSTSKFGVRSFGICSDDLDDGDTEFRALATADIFYLRNGLQVIWPNAGRNTAKMVKYKSGRDRTISRFPCNDMRGFCFAVDSSTAIPEFALGSLPYMTWRPVSAIFNNKLDRRDSRVVIAHESHKFPSNDAFSKVGFDGPMSDLSTSTLAQPRWVRRVDATSLCGVPAFLGTVPRWRSFQSRGVDRERVSADLANALNLGRLFGHLGGLLSGFWGVLCRGRHHSLPGFLLPQFYQIGGS